MCSFATEAGSRVMTSAAGCGRVRVVTLEKKLIFCSCCTGFVFRSLVYKVLALVSLKRSGVVGGQRLHVLFEDPATWAWPGLNRYTSDARAPTSFVSLPVRLVIEMVTP